MSFQIRPLCIRGRSERSAVSYYEHMVRRLFTWWMNLYRLIVGVIVLAIVIPAWISGVQAMWLVAIVCILVVIGAVAAGTRVRSLRNWLRH